MTDFQAIADRVEIEALRGEFTDAGMQRDYDRIAALFTVDGVVRFDHVPAEFLGRAEIRAAVARLQPNWEFFVQNVHAGIVELDGDTATGRAYMHEFGRFQDGTSHQNYAIYHDRYVRTPDGWRFAERRYEVRYQDDSPLPGTGTSPTP